MAIKVEFGKCAACNENNPKQLKVCRKCSAPLPWAKAPRPQVTKSPAPKSRAASASFDWGLLGVGAISFLIPLIGFFLYRSYSDRGDDKAGVALIGLILGILAHIARFALRAASS